MKRHLKNIFWGLFVVWLAFMGMYCFHRYCSTWEKFTDLLIRYESGEDITSLARDYSEGLYNTYIRITTESKMETRLADYDYERDIDKITVRVINGIRLNALGVTSPPPQLYYDIKPIVESQAYKVVIGSTVVLCLACGITFMVMNKKA